MATADVAIDTDPTAKSRLAAVRRQQALAERAAATEQQGRAFVALARVVAIADRTRPTPERAGPRGPRRQTFRWA